MKKKFSILINFSGAGSKLLQSHISGCKEVFTLPGYPLIYLPFFYSEWINNTKKLNIKKILKLFLKQHASVLDSRLIKGFNGLDELGRKKKGFIKISKKKFSKYFISYFKNKKINLKNLIEAIHFSYQYAVNDKSKKIFYHVHDLHIYQRYLAQSFKDSKIIIMTRNPIPNFWRRFYADRKIEKIRFDKTDQEYLLNHGYIIRLLDIYLQFKNIDKNFKNKNCKFFLYEDLKNNNQKTLKKITSFLGYNFSYNNMRIPKFGNQLWWSSKIYQGYSQKKILHKKENSNFDKSFFFYEIIILKFILKPYLKKFKYESKFNKIFNNFFVISLLFCLPTKYGISIFFQRLNPYRFLSYIKYSYKESFNPKCLKNYYFNGMYKFKYFFKFALIIKYNLVRKFLFFNKKNFLLSILNFFIKFFLYFFLFLELFLFYFLRIFLLFQIFKNLKKNINNISKY